jgi:bla regulator protein BlaR1
MNVADLVGVSQSALDVLWRASWQASVLVGLVLVAQWLLRKRAAARWRYNLWAVVLIRLALPVTPSSSWSVFNLLPDRRENLPAAKVEYARASAPVAARPEAMMMILPQGGEMVQPTTKAAVVTASAPEVVRAAEPVKLRSEKAQREIVAGEAVGGAAGWLRWYPGAVGVRLAGVWLAAAWLAGVLVLAARIAWASIGLQLAVRRLAEVDDWDVLDVLEQATLEIGVTRRLRVLVAPIVSTPALMGVIRP